MQQTPSVILRKEQALFDLLCCVNELRQMRSELSSQDCDQIDQEIEKLRFTFKQI
ncbi:hypothetical protein [Legionella sp. CNM-4043-24]|uniref:hypothetical protein n=1 Tax=Legionella sp. CNM-4043-24 TaxID=3421646 RepID=UPI00403A872D